MNEKICREAFKLVLELKKAGRTVSVAESMTGGLISAAITEIPGASGVFGLGVCAYAVQAKAKMLRMDAKMIKRRGAVSFQTAALMAENVRKLSHSDIAVSVSGLAGPAGATPETPVGSVWIGFATPGETGFLPFHFTGNRREIREKAVLCALRTARILVRRGAVPREFWERKAKTKSPKKPTPKKANLNQ